MIRAAALSLCLWAAGLTSAAQAASFDPDLTWRTLETPHFRITFHGEEEQLAEEMARVGEVVWAKMTEELKEVPRRPIELVLVDQTDSANGYAMTLPLNTIVIYVTAPTEDSTLSTYEDWNDAILTHEFTHILHLDSVEGIPQLLRFVVGRIVSVNRMSPGWIIEGQATFQETRHTNAGRGRSTYVDMIKRMTVLEGDFPPLGNLDGFQVEPPGGNLRYLFGQDFQQYIADVAGEDVWTDFIHRYAGGIPYWMPSKTVFGRRFYPLYRDWRAELTARYSRQAEQISAEGLTPFRLLSDGVDQCAAPTFSPDGSRLVWSCSDPQTGSAIWLADGAGEGGEVELANFYATDFTWRQDGKAFAYSSLHTVNRFNLYSDLYFHTVGGSTQALTGGKRVRSPDFSADGRDLYAITNKAQNTQLVRLTVDQRLEALTENKNHEQMGGPAVSPDGRTVALSVWVQGQRDLYLYDTEGRVQRRLTVDGASDIDPSWSVDGETLYFASDRSGVWNIYAIDLAAERLYQITNVLGGAMRPSVHPDGTAMVFESFSTNGFDVAWMELDRATWRDRGDLPLSVEARAPLSEVLPKTPIPPPSPPPKAKEEAKPPKGREARKARRAARRQESTDPGPAYGMLTEAYGFPGLTGLGGPYDQLQHMPGRWGLPGEGVAPGEFAPDAPSSGADVDDPTQVDEEKKEEDFPFSYPVHRYNPLQTLFPPRFVVPSLYLTSDGLMGVLSTSGTDTLRHYIYSAYGSYRTDARFVGWGASAALNRFIPVYSAGVYSYVVPYGEIYALSPLPAGGSVLPSIYDTGYSYWDQRTRAYAQASYALDSYQSIYGGWSGTLREPMDDLPAGAYRPLLPDRGFFSELSVGWRTSRGRYMAKSISPEEARVLSVVGKLSHPLLGSYTLDDLDQPAPFTQVQLSADWREYQTLPWAHNHVLATKVAAGISGGDQQRYGSYRLGGDFGESSYYTLPDEWRALRGFEPGTVYGDWYYLATAEYRLPLWYVDRGVGTLPFFAQSLSAAAFIDTGNAFLSLEEEGALAGTLIGTGAELRGTAVVLWGVPAMARVGYAFALRGEGIPLGSLAGTYVWLGSSF